MNKTKVCVLFFGIIFLLLGGVLATAQEDLYILETNLSTYGNEHIEVYFTNNFGREIEVSGPVKIKVWSPGEWNREWDPEELDPEAGDEVFSGTIAEGEKVTIAEIAPGLPHTWRPYEQMNGDLEFTLYIEIDGVEYWHSLPLVHTVKRVDEPNYELVLTTNSPTDWETPRGESIILKLTNKTGAAVTVSGPAVVLGGAVPESYELMGGDTMTIADGETVEVAEITPGSPVSWRAFYFPQSVALQVWFQVDGKLDERLWQSPVTYHVVEGAVPSPGLWKREGSVLDATDNMDGTATIWVAVNHVEWWNEFSVDTKYEQSDWRYVVGFTGKVELEPATGLTKDQFFVQRPTEGGGQEHVGTLLSVREIAPETDPGVYELCWHHEPGTHDIFLEARVPGSEDISVLFPPPLEVTISELPQKVDAKLNPDTGRYEAQLSWLAVDLDISSAQEVDATILVQRKGKSSHPPGPGMNPAGIYMEITVTEGSLEGAEVLIEVAYSLEDLPPGMKESDLRLFRYNESRGEWELCGATEDERGVDTKRRVIWAMVPGFSEFAVFEYSPDVEPVVELPATAGALPLLSGAGLALLATAGLAVLRRRRHR